MPSCWTIALIALQATTQALPVKPEYDRVMSSTTRACSTPTTGHGSTNVGVRALSSSIASPNAWVGRGLALIPVFAIFLAWLSYARIRSRGALREAERAAVFASIGSRLIARQEEVLRSADRGQPITPSDRPS